MKALVTLGEGSIGYHLVKQLLEKKHKVICYGLAEASELAKLGAKIVRADINDLVTLTAACKDVNVVFHTASVNGGGFVSDTSTQRDYERFHKGNVLATQNVINACTSQGVAKLIYTSSSSVVAGPPSQGVDESEIYAKDFVSHFQKTKVMAELRVLSANGLEGLRTTAIRPHFVWGPGDTCSLPTIIKLAAAGKLKIIGDGHNKISVAYVENVAHAHILAAQSFDTAGNAYFIAEEKPVFFWKWFNMILDELNIPTVTEKISYQQAIYGSRFKEFLNRFFNYKVKPLYPQSLGDLLTHDQYFSTTRAIEDFAYEPLVSPKDALDRSLQYYRGQLL